VARGGGPGDGDGDTQPPPQPDFPTGSILPSASVGYLPGEPSVSPTGEAQYEIPLKVPPGREGIQPVLALAYRSGGGNGMAGVGWSVTGAYSAITRCPQTHASEGATDGVDWDATDSYCLDGDKLVRTGFDAADSAVVFRFENDRFSRVKAYVPANDPDAEPTSFQIWSRDGRVSFYEAKSGPRIFLGQLDWSPVNALWVLVKVRDTTGNSMLVSHEDDSLDTASDDPAQHAVELYPSHIQYTASATSLPLRSVRFIYEDRAGFDQAMRYGAGVRQQKRRRLKRIEMWAPPAPNAGPALAWQYELTYTLSDSTFRSLLTSVRMRDASGAALWARQFAWNTQDDGWDLASVPVATTMIDPTGQPPPTTPGWCHPPPPETTTLALDADGDGKDDLLYWDGYECIQDLHPQYPNIWGQAVWHLKLRLSSNGPLATEYEVGQAHKNVCEGDPYCFEGYMGPRLSASRPIDFDGDGDVELFEANSVGGGVTEYALVRWNPGTHVFDPLTGWSAKRNAELVDVDGDGLIDLIESVNDHWYVRLNQGPPGFGFGPQLDPGLEDTTDDGIVVTPGDCPGRHAQVGDFDGDGRGDLLVPGTSCLPNVILSRNDNAWLITTPTDLEGAVGNLLFQAADVNGDGLRDILVGNGTGPALLRINTGRGFLPPMAIANGPSGVDKLRPIDINGDGREDLLGFERVSQNPDVYDMSLYVSMVGADPTAAAFVRIALQSGLHASDPSLNTGDFDGDGIPELVGMTGGLWLRDFQIPSDLDTLVAVSDEGASHASTQFAYSRAWSDAPSPDTCAYPQTCIKTGITVVRELKRSQGEALLPAYRTTRYSYDRPRSDMRGRGFLGFGEVRELEVGSWRQTTTTYDLATRFANNQLEMYPFAAQPQTVTTIAPLIEMPEAAPATTPPGSPVRARVTVTANAHEVALTSSDIYRVRLRSWVTTEAEDDVAITAGAVTIVAAQGTLRERTGSRRYDAYDNVAIEDKATTGGVRDEMVATYLNDIANQWVIGLPLRVATLRYDQDDAVPLPRVTQHEYDSYDREWRTTRQPDQPSSSQWQQTVLDRDANGVVWRKTTSVATGQPARVTIELHDAEGIFIENARNPAGHWTTVLHDPARGVPLLEVDPNGVTTHRTFDGFGRPIGVIPGAGVPTTTSYAAYQPVVGVNAGLITTVDGDDGSRAVHEDDELGRRFEDRTLAFDGTWAVVGTGYNVFGARTRVTRPGADQPGAPAKTFYDGLGRVVRSVAADGATTLRTQKAFQTTTVDPDGHERVEFRDIDDRVEKTIACLGPLCLEPVTMQFTYSPFDQLETAIDPDGNVTTMSYDIVGRRTSLEDPDAGLTTYEHDGFDEVATEIDALGTRTIHHDVLGRPTSINDAGGTRYVAYDYGPHGYGKPARTESPDGVVVQYAYDAAGLLATETWTVGYYGPTPESFAIDTKHDAWGRVERVAYPDVPNRPRFTVESHYNTRGYLDELRDVSGATPALLWRVDGRELDGTLAKSSFDKGPVTEVLHDAQNGRVANVTAYVDSANPLHSISYIYTPGGNVATRSAKVTERDETFDYDGLDRLTTWTLSSPTSAFPERVSKYRYDHLGNLEQVEIDGKPTDLTTFGWNGKPHAAATLDGKPFVYDPTGNQLDSPFRITTYTTFDLPRQVIDKASGSLTSYEYNADGVRARKVGAGPLTTVYVGNLYERRTASSGAAQHVFYVGDGDAVMQIVRDDATATEAKLYFAADALGSVQTVIDESGVVVDQRYVEPFGGRTGIDGTPASVAPSAVTRGFTAHEEENELELINMKGRIYDPRQRRFVSPDPVTKDPHWSQYYNHYSYVENNPLRLTDPTGMQSESDDPDQEMCTVDDKPTIDDEECTLDDSGDVAPAPKSPTSSESTGKTPQGTGEREVDDPKASGAAQPTSVTVWEPGDRLMTLGYSSSASYEFGVTFGLGVYVDRRGEVGVYANAGVLAGFGFSSGPEVGVQMGGDSPGELLDGWSPSVTIASPASAAEATFGQSRADLPDPRLGFAMSTPGLGIFGGAKYGVHARIGSLQGALQAISDFAKVVF